MAMAESEGARGPTPPSDVERDVLVQLRANSPRAGDAQLPGRVEAIEVLAHTLQEDLASLQAGLPEAESRHEAAEDRARQAEDGCLRAEERRLEADQRRLDAELRREHVERLLLQMRRAGVRMELTVGELRDVVARLRQATERLGVPSAEPSGGDSVEQVDDRAQMADALAAAIERLRTRVAAVGEPAPRPSAPVEVRPPHKHSMSGLARWRMRRRQRRAR